MTHGRHRRRRWAASMLVVMAWAIVPAAEAVPVFGPEELVQAGGADVAVGGYSVPSFVDWDSDGRKDLVVGEGGGSGAAKVRVYLNTGTASAPGFGGFFYAQAAGADLTTPAAGCLGLYPRVVHWDGDGRKDLLVGQSDGTLKLFRNIGTDAAPTFDGGMPLDVGAPGAKSPIDVGSRATPVPTDWNGDGVEDLLVGALDGTLRVYVNQGTDGAPDFRAETRVQADGADLVVPSVRSSPAVADLDGDGVRDLLSGNTAGQLVLYRNLGSNAAPIFAGYELAQSGGAAIDLPGSARSRPFVCDWTGDGALDVLAGAGDGKVHLFQGIPPGEPPVAVLLLEVLTAAGPVALSGGERVNAGSSMRFSDASSGEPVPQATLTLNGAELPLGVHAVAAPSFLLGDNAAMLHAANALGEARDELRFEVVATPEADLELRVDGSPAGLAGVHVLYLGDVVTLDGSGSRGTIERWSFARGADELASGTDPAAALLTFTAGRPGETFAVLFAVENTALGEDRHALAVGFTVVPEPSVLTLAAAGLVALARRRRGR